MYRENPNIDYTNEDLKSILTGKNLANNAGFTYDNNKFRIDIQNIIFKEKVIIDYPIIFNEVGFIDCHFQSTFIFQGNFDSTLIIARCLCTELEFAGKFDGNVWLNQLTCKTIRFINVDYKNIEIGRPVKIDKIYFSNSKVETLDISSYKDENIYDDIEIVNCKFGRLWINGSTIYNLTISGELDPSNSLILTILKINILRLSQIYNQSKFFISEISAINHPTINVSSKFIISQCRPEIQFYNIDLKSFGEVKINNSYLGNCSFENIAWPEHINSAPDAKKDNRYYQDQREVYRQFKVILQKQGNTYEEQIFHAKELSALEKSLSIKTHFWTKLIISLSRISSDFGLSIIRPVLFLFIVNVCFFIGLFLLENAYSGPIAISINSGSLIDKIGLFIQYLNPLHNYDETLKGAGVIIDSIMRIVSSYSIYNFIRASRRFIK